MIHKHHEWLADANADIIKTFEREQATASESGHAQETGHSVESNWDDVLTDWLPPQYEIGKRKYLMLETDDGAPLTKETDLVVFHPHYPTKLRKKSHVLASGVAAAFSVKRTVGRKDIVEAYEDAAALRRGMRLRGVDQKHYLVPPLFYGLLGQSHEWKAPSSTPAENVRDISIQLDRELVVAPREALDFICIADLGTWTRKTIVLPQQFLDGGVENLSRLSPRPDGSRWRRFPRDVGAGTQLRTGESVPADQLHRRAVGQAVDQRLHVGTLARHEIRRRDRP
ncbi:MAG: hypothetical protein KDB26_10390 [Microthrixaceae bacterium]|nr:hypothetical protein [Microthrixaceae bacterium]